MEEYKINSVIGVDPGASNGGIAWFYNGEMKTYNMPKDMKDLEALLEHIKSVCTPYAGIEKVQVRHDDVDNTPGKIFRIKNMIANYEQLKTTFELYGVPFCLVHPMTWQSKLKVRVKGEEKPERKRRFKEIAKELYPGVKVTLKTADAMLICHFVRYALINEKNWIKSNTPEKVRGELFK